MGKVFEKPLLTRMKIHIILKILPEQFGLRNQYTTTRLQVTNVLDHITDELDLRHRTAAILLDIEKSFDKVWNDGLIFKLMTMDIPTELINILRAFLTNRTFRVKVEDKNSTS